MATRSSFNKNNSAVKRIMQEARELANDPSTEYTAAPLEDNLFEWHCTLRGAPETDFEGGLYHFRILLPAEYPFRPPSLMMLTPSGRFETNTKLCISFTNYHEELWQPAWGVRTAIIGLQGFFPLKGQAAMGVGSMEAPGSERRRLAKLSRDWVCPQCKVPNHECLPDAPQVDSHASCSISASTVCSGDGGDPRRSFNGMNDDNGDAEEPADGSASAEQMAGSGAMLITESNALSSASDSNSGSVAMQNLQGTGSPARSGGSERSTAEDREIVERQRREQEATVTAVEIVSATSSGSHSHSRSSRPPILLDATISVLLVFVAALLCKKMI